MMNLAMRRRNTDGDVMRRTTTEPTNLGSKKMPLQRQLTEDYLFHPTRRTYATVLSTYNRLVGDCVRCSLSLWCQDHSGFSTLSFNEAEQYMRTNPYIKKGYRPELPHTLCVRSLLSWNNETLNIWTHLVGLVAFFFLCVYDNFVTLPSIPGSDMSDHLIVTITAVAYMVCMLGSTLYHLFCCMSEGHNKFWLQIDLLGIVFGMLGVYLSGIYYAFYCHHGLHNLYLSVFVVLSCFAVGALFHPRYTEAEFAIWRSLLYSTIAAYGVIPTCHWVYIHSLASETTQRFLPNVVVVYGICIIALCFYLTMFPERLFPGKLDHVGHSHQVWHILIMAALLYWRTHGFELMKHTIQLGCRGPVGGPRP